ncbi:MAG: hypothetical protein LLG13_17705 [Bacteroidales bacterium]|nr:hypothetical protein [Bacteroidales bacterium]
MKTIKILIIALLVITSCTGSYQVKKLKQEVMAIDSTKLYGYNRDFLKKHVNIIELKNSSSAIIVVPAWQGRVMTSTAEGDTGFSFGWINQDLIASGKTLTHINPFGGEERLWLGPEGGQYSIFFKKGKPFIYDEWQTPSFLDTTPYEIIASTDSSALFRTDVTTENYSGTILKLRIEREVTLLTEKMIASQTGIDINGLNCVAYRSENTIINQGDKEWKKETGLLSIWMLGMFNPAPSVVVVVPVKSGDENLIGPIVNDNYFGKISNDRLKIAGNHIFFKADGKSRGKIGFPPLRSTGIIGSYDSDNKILTILMCKLPEGKNEYVNSAWQLQENPYSGDAINAYNDGPLENGSQMGPFYEIETSSPAVELKPEESLNHIQFTMHLTGDVKDLDKVSRRVLGVSLEEISSAF